VRMVVAVCDMCFALRYCRVLCLQPCTVCFVHCYGASVIETESCCSTIKNAQRCEYS
jgi:hypothetical protein